MVKIEKLAQGEKRVLVRSVRELEEVDARSPPRGGRHLPLDCETRRVRILRTELSSQRAGESSPGECGMEPSCPERAHADQVVARRTVQQLQGPFPGRFTVMPCTGAATVPSARQVSPGPRAPGHGMATCSRVAPSRASGAAPCRHHLTSCPHGRGTRSARSSVFGRSS